MALKVKGEFVDAKREPWKSDPSRFNYDVIIKTGEYETRYGEIRGEYLRLTMDADNFTKFEALSKGQMVETDIRVIPKEGRKGPYVVYWVPKNATIRAARAAA